MDCTAILVNSPVKQTHFEGEFLTFPSDCDGPRGGSGKLDSMVSGSLASLKPPSNGEHKEQGKEENETESRSDL